jgi:hypothetical protein
MHVACEVTLYLSLSHTHTHKTIEVKINTEILWLMLLLDSTLSQLNPIPSPYSIFIRYILMLSSYLRLGLQYGLLPWGFPTKNAHGTYLHICYMSHPSYPTWFNHLNNIKCRSQWPRSLGRVWPWTAQTLRSWVRILLEPGMYVWVFLCRAVLWR